MLTSDHLAWIDQLEWVQGINFHGTESDPVPLITFGPTCFYRGLATDSLAAAQRDHYRSVVCSTFAGLREAARAGLGVGILNSRNRTSAHRPRAEAGGMPPLPRIAQISRIRTGAPPETQDLAELLTAKARTSDQTAPTANCT